MASNHDDHTFWPDDTEDTIYFSSYGNTSWDFIRGKISEKWPGINDNELTFSAEHIQTHCVGYQRYDPSDYSNFIVVTAQKSYFDRTKKKA